jgi:hypothetical protein
MVTLSLADTKRAIQAAFEHYLDQDDRPFTLRLGGHDVTVTIEVRSDRFDCGTPGFNMNNSDVVALRAWVPQHVRAGSSTGALAACKQVGATGQVNAYLLALVTFNFHVNLVSPC